MSKVFKSIAFDRSRVERELRELDALLNDRPELSETDDIHPFFKAREQLSAFFGTFLPDLGPATELAFEFPFFGDYRADLLVGNRATGEFLVVEFEDGRPESIFKKQPRRTNAEWSVRFEHGFGQLVDWFFHLDDFKNTKNFANTFGHGHIRFSGLLVIGRNAGLDEAKRNRLKWRTEKVLIDSHPINCVTFDDLYTTLNTRIQMYRAASKQEK